ncbi:MAG: D-2-hydroxyacid dehydrogenase [Chloroflexales bacterium]|nr:D-2-hydroxyacid dehydrogenase [Chloroflexales bacterium]
MKIILPNQIAADVEPLLPSDIHVIHMNTEGECDADPSDAEVLFRWWTPGSTLDKILVSAPKLRWIHTPSAGVDHLLTPSIVQREIVLTNNAGGHAIPIAEFVLAYLLTHAKHLPALHAAQAEHHWSEHRSAQELMDATLLIIGLGGIGQAIAERAATFGMRVWGSRRTAHSQDNDYPGVTQIVSGDAWRTLLPDADYVVIATPLTPETRGMIDATALRAMRPSAYLVNIARGAIIDEAALLTALREGWIAGAALDTFETEPLPPDSPFWSLPNVFVTPHCSALSPRLRQRAIALFLDNLTRYQQRQPLRNVVDKEAGY